MTDNHSNRSSRFNIVPGEDELLSRPRPGVRPIVKAFSWPTFMIALIALIAVCALAFVYWQDRQTFINHSEQFTQLMHSHQLDEQRIQSLEQEVGTLSKSVDHSQQQIDAIPVINPQQINGLEVQTSALNLAVQRLNQQVSPNENSSDQQQSIQKSMDAIDQTQSALGQRMGALESRMDSLAATLKTMQHDSTQSN